MKLRTIPFYLILFILSACDVVPEEPNMMAGDADNIIFSKDPNGHNELYKLEDGEQTVILSDTNYDYWWAKVSPDKSQFLVYRSPSDPDKNHDNYQNAELLLVNIDGTNQRVLIKNEDYNWRAQGVCRWSPDGSQILMCAEIETETGYQWRLVLTDREGKNPKVLSDRWAIDCNFSRDGNSVVYMGFAENKLTLDLTKLELQIGDLDQNNSSLINIRSLSNNNSRDHDPSFSPDDKTIVFSGGNLVYSDVDLILYDTENQEETILLDDQAANGGSMCWSLDGDYVYFHSLHLLRAPFRIKRIDIATKTVETVLQIEGNSHGFFHPEVY